MITMICHPGLDPGSRYQIALHTRSTSAASAYGWIPGQAARRTAGMTKIENHTQLVWQQGHGTDLTKLLL